MTAAVLTAADGDLPDIPGQPYVSPDDLASIGPMWQQAVQQQLVPVVAEVYQTSAGVVHAQMVDATQVPTLPSVGSLAAEQYLAAASNTFEQVGDDLWATARSELLDGFEKGESIDQLAARLRASAGMTAKKAVLVARTQVLDASNAGSIATARASGIDMQKEWMSAEDLRVRPEHVLANGQKVDLNAKFTVGGYECDRPHDPTLPPALRYSCRCTTGYLIPEDSVDDAVDDAKPVPPIPGTSGVVEPLPDPYAGDLVSPALPGPDLGLPDIPPATPLTVRPTLEAARTNGAVHRVFTTEYRRITGRDIDPNSVYFEGSVATAREHAEGVLRGLERFPDVPLERVVAFGTGNEYASATSRAIRFNQVWTSPADRKKYLDALAQDAASGWHPAGSRSPIGIALHEFGHVLDAGKGIHPDLDGLLARAATARDVELAARRAAGELIDAADVAAGSGVDGLISREVSRYATKNREELVAEAFADVMTNGEAASQLSRDIFSLLEAEYRRTGGVVRAVTTEALPALPSPAAALAARTVPQLRALAKERGITIPAGSKKADIVRLLDEGPGPAPAGGPMRVLDVEIIPTPAVTGPIDVAAQAREYAARQGTITRILDAPEVTESKFAGGQMGGAHLITTPTGQRAVVKDLPRAAEFARHQGDAEVLVARVHDALGLRSTAAVRRGDRVGMEFIPGTPGEDVARGGFVPAEVLDSRDGRVLGLADLLTRTPDRVGGNNWILTSEGRIVGFDNGGAFSSIDSAADRWAGGRSAFAERYVTLGPDRRPILRDEIDISPDELADVRARIEALRSEFAAAGRERWHDQMLDSLSQIERRAAAQTVAPAVAPAVEVPLAKRTVAQLRALAAERKIVIPKGAKKPDIVRLLEAPPLTQAEQRAAARALARETNALIEQTSATARALAEVDELLAKKASASTIREAIADALTEPGQLFAGADPAVLAALRAVASDPVKLRAAVTRLGGKAKIKPVSKAGAKVTFDADTMEGVGGIDIPAGARVTVVRRGSTVTLPDGTVMQLEKARVTPVTAPAKKVAAPKVTPEARLRVLFDEEPTDTRRLGGDSAYTNLVTYPDGQRAIEKVYGVRVKMPASEVKHELDAEELAPLVLRALGIRAPSVVRQGNRLLMEEIDGQVGADIWDIDLVEKAMKSKEGRLLGLADVLMANTDRNMGNWILLPGGRRIAGIDHGLAFQQRGPTGRTGGWIWNSDWPTDLTTYDDNFDIVPAATNLLNPADLAIIRERLEALRPAFEQLGRLDWYNEMMGRLAVLTERARGKRRTL